MKYSINEKIKTPAYFQLYIQLRDDIINGIYPTGSKLPSKRTIASDMGVSTITIEHAYSLLCEEGYAEAHERSGYFVTFHTDDGFIPVIKHNENLQNKPERSSNTNTQFPFSVLSKTMRKVITDIDTGILEKSPNLGCLSLRKAICDYLARSKGIIADIDQVIIGSGSEYLYTILVELLGRNRTYAIESPSYKKIEQVYTASDVHLQKLPLSDNGIDSNALRNCQANILHISPYRSYPSGVTASASKRHEYIRWAEKDERYIIEDDFESEFSLTPKNVETLFSHSSKDNVIYMNTFSKTISSSFRIGYMVLPKHLALKYEKELGFMSCTVPTYIQYVIAELLTNGDFERHLNRIRRNKRKQTPVEK